MKFFLIIIAALTLYSSCVRDRKVPADVLDQDEMADVMWDLARADEFVTTYVLKDSALNRKEESIKKYEQVFMLHETNKEEFEKSIAFYKSRPDLLKVIMDSLRNYENKYMQKLSVPETPAVDSFTSDTSRRKFRIKSATPN